MARNKYPEKTIETILDASTRLFTEKGYDVTSLQDIINETKLSKGAIYHHFGSKEEIFEAICDKIGQENAVSLAKIRDNKKMNGYEKLKAIYKAALFSSNQNLILTVSPSLLDNPKFLSVQIRQLFETVAPEYIEPILQQGIDDGTIKVENPHELAEAMMILTNIWLNPLVHPTDVSGMRERAIVFNKLMQGMGIDLLDNEVITGYTDYCVSQRIQQ